MWSRAHFVLFFVAAYALSVSGSTCDVTLQPTANFSTDYAAAIAGATNDITVCLVGGGAYSGCTTHGSPLAVYTNGEIHSVSVNGNGATLSCCCATTAFSRMLPGPASTLANLTVVSTAHDVEAASLIWVSPSSITVSDLTVIGGSVTAISIGLSESAHLTNVNVTGLHCNICIGGVTVSSATVWVTACSFSNNRFQYAPALNILDTATVVVTDSVFQDNVALSEGGGALNIDYSTLTTANCTFNNNNATSDTEGEGGVILMVESSWTSTGDTLRGNTAAISGGAVSAVGSYTLSFTSTVFENNVVIGNGGAIYVSGADFTMSDCTFRNNTATQGAAVALEYGSVQWSGNTFVSNNAALLGGAVFLSVTVYSTGDVYENNIAHEGGALYMTGGLVVCDGVTFSSNTAGIGGAILLSNGATVNATRSHFTTNTATTSGGGVYVSKHCFFNANMSTVVGNSAASQGGGFMVGPGSFVETAETCVENNSAPTGSAAFLSSCTWDMTNTTTLVGNTVSGTTVVGSVSKVDWCPSNTGTETSSTTTPMKVW